MKRERRPKHLHAAIALIEARGRLLICRRRADDSFGGCWEFPGGKREPRETWEACLRRELKEELGVSVRALRPHGHLRYRYSKGAIFFKVYRCAIAQGTPRPLASTALRWVRPDRLLRYRFPPANRRLIAQLVVQCHRSHGRPGRPARQDIHRR